MKQFILMTAVLLLIFSAFGQSPPPPPSPKPLDSLKKDIKAIGNLFKKAGTVTVTIDSIQNTDNNLLVLKQNLLHTIGVKKVEDHQEQNIASFVITYKGKGTDLWQAVPQSTQKLFTLKAANDTTVTLHYNNAATAKAVTPANNMVVKKETQTISNEVKPGATKVVSTSLSPEAALLFKNVKTKLTDAEKNTLATGFVLSKDKKQFIQDNESADYPYDVFIYPTDMNKDGKEEIFILSGNSYTSGMTGSNIAVLIAGKGGGYSTNLGFPGTLPDALATGVQGYPDLLIGGPGFEFPVWRWNGKEYIFYKNVKEAEYEKMKTTSIEVMSKVYTGTL